MRNDSRSPRRIAIAVAALALLLMVVAIVGSEQDSASPSAPATGNVATTRGYSTTQEEPAGPSERNHKIGESFSVGYWSYRCNGARWQDAISSGGEPLVTPDAAFLVVDLSITNNDRTASILPPMVLVDSLGREFDQSSRAIFMPGSFDPLKELNPSVSSRGIVVFDAPEGAYALKVSGGIESGQHALIDLSQPSQVGLPSTVSQQSGRSISHQSEPLTGNLASYNNPRFGYTIAFPSTFTSKEFSDKGESLFVSPDGFARLIVTGKNNNNGSSLQEWYDLYRKSLVNGQIVYSKFGTNWFVITWLDGHTVNYEKVFVGKGSINLFLFFYPDTQRSRYDSIATMIEKSFKPGQLEQAW